MNILPKARMSDIVVQNLDGETLVYDLVIDKAFCLNETLGIIFNACDSQSSFEDLKRSHKFSDEIIFLALDELAKANLLAENAEFVSPFAGMTRREVIRKVGLASMIALPLISGLVAPTAAIASSTCNPVTNGCVCPSGTATSCGLGNQFGMCQPGCTCFSPGCQTVGVGCSGNCR